MSYTTPYSLNIPVGVCSEDNVNYDIRVLDHDGTLFSESIARSGNTLPQVTFNNFLFGVTSSGCPGRLRISGTIGAGENEVTLALSGDNISACGGLMYDYASGSFDAEVTVPLTLAGDCPEGFPKEGP